MTLRDPIEISSREKPVGGKINPIMLENLSPEPTDGQHLKRLTNDVRMRRLRDVTIFVHGFHTSEHDARKNWEQTRRELEHQLLNPQRARDIAHYFWPGDPGRFLRRRLAYASAVRRAHECGPALANYLLGLTKLRTVTFVGHSLGCRVVLETLKRIRARPSNLRPTGSLLMAAAVPEGLCEEGALLPRSAASVADGESILYSRHDWVLMLAFPPGQLAAETLGDPFIWPGAREAVGRNGRPADRWIHVTKVERGHNEYWDRPDTVFHITRLLGTPRKRLFKVRKPLERPMYLSP